MASCQVWQDFFEETLRYTRGIGSTAPIAPEGLPPEGCTLSPCFSLFSVAVMIDTLRTALQSRDNLNATKPPDCPARQVRATRSLSFGNYTPGWEVYAPAGGSCSGFSQKLFYGQTLDCDPGPPPPEPTGDTAPLEFTITGGPWNGTTIQSLAVVGPTAQGLQKVIDGSLCICEQLVITNSRLGTIITGFEAIIQLLGNLRDIGLQTQRTSSDVQNTWAALIQAIANHSVVTERAIEEVGVQLGGSVMNDRPVPQVFVKEGTDLQPINI